MFTHHVNTSHIGRFDNVERVYSIDDVHVSRERHISSLKNTIKHLEKSKKNNNFDLFAEDIRLAMKEISKISGNIDIEDILEIIFNDFCIGK